MDAILYWNDVALEANQVSHTNGKKEQTGPPLSARALAIVHLAMYDAFAAASFDPVSLPPYLESLPTAPPGISPDAAAAGAAHFALSALFPSQKASIDASLAAAPLTGTVAEISGGKTFGQIVAQAILADRAADPGVGDAGFVTSTARGRHRVDPDNPGQGVHGPFYGAQSNCFAVTARHGLDKPPQPGDADYVTALRQVEAKGIAPHLAGTLPASVEKRTASETIKGIFWAHDGSTGIGTPPRFYNKIIQMVAKDQNNSPAENARLFALVNVAMADAGILAWEQKFIHDLWRPIVAIREHDPSMGPEAKGSHDLVDDTDPGWLPLGAPASNDVKKNLTPPFPAYPSGHATFGAAAFEMTRLFYGYADHGPDHLVDGLEFVSDEFDGVNKDNTGAIRPRHVRRFSDMNEMIEENSVSRVFLGVHWIFDGFVPNADGSANLDENIGGVPLGMKIATDIYNGGRAAGLKKSDV